MYLKLLQLPWLLGKFCSENGLKEEQLCAGIWERGGEMASFFVCLLAFDLI